MMFGIFGPAYAHGSRFDAEQKKGGSFFAAVLITVFLTVFEVLCIVEMADGKSGYIYPIVILALIVFFVWFYYLKSMAAKGNPYKKGIRVIGMIEDSDSFTPKDTYGYVEAKQYDPCESAHGFKAYRISCKVVNPHTGEEMLCISKGSYENIDVSNIKEVPVYFHKRKTYKYYVDVREAIVLSENK